MDRIIPIPLKRFVIEPSLTCNITCRFCYHLHRKSEWHKTVKSLGTVINEIDAGIKRGNNYIDVTGGEPTIYPYLTDMIVYANSKNIKTCVITNGIVSEERTKQIIHFGIDDWLVSRHGLEATHNFITNNRNGYQQQLRFLRQVREHMDFRFNCVISKFNQTEILEITKEVAEFQPRIANWIHFNPHHSWRNNIEETKNIIADLNTVAPLLNEAIAYMESHGIGVNIRYYPMCKIDPEYRRCVCNDLHVMFDPYEWDYSTTPKTVERYYQWGVATSNANEEKGEPCCHCDLQWVCGGMNKYAHAANTALFGEQLIPIVDSDAKAGGFYYYRQHNSITLQER